MCGTILVGVSSCNATPTPLAGSDECTGAHAGGQGGHARSAAVGDVLILCGQLIIAFKNLVEEFILKERKLPPEFVAGFEGVWGNMLMLVLFVPVLRLVPDDERYDGLHEDVPRAFQDAGSSTALLLLLPM